MKKMFLTALLVVVVIAVFFVGLQSATQEPTVSREPKAAGDKFSPVLSQPTEAAPLAATTRDADAAFKEGISAWEAGKHKLPPDLRLDKEAARSDPRSEPFRAKARERWVEHAYGDAFKKLNLTGGQVAGMRDLLAKRELSLSEFDTLAGKSSAGAEALSSARQASVSGIDQQISDLIGTETYAELKSLRQRSVKNLSQAYLEAGLDLSIAGIPLNDDQAKSLAVIYDQRRPLPGAAPSPHTELPADLHRVFERAKQHLSADQLDVFLATLRSKAEHERFIAEHMVPAK